MEIVEINKDANPNTLWELVKGTIRNETIKYASKKNKIQNKKEKQLTSEIYNLEKDIESTLNNLHIEEITHLLKLKKEELNEIIEKRINGIILRSKCQYVENHEKNTKYFASLEKKQAEKKIILKLNVNNNIITDITDILNAQSTFYSKLYEKRAVQQPTFNFFNNTMPSISEAEKIKCEGILTEYECFMSLKNMQNNKSPGSDGITTEFYKIFWNDIKLYLINSLNYSNQIGELTELQKQGIITLLPKTGKDINKLENWRPISLLNVDIKIATKAIANRIKPTLNTIISHAQTGFIKGRYIGENIRLLFEILDYIDENELPALLFFSDFEKAFDSLDHDFMLRCLKQFNFGDSIINWVKLFYSDSKSFTINNGHISDCFPEAYVKAAHCHHIYSLFVLSFCLMK